MGGIGYFFKGLKLLFQPGIRPFVVMPLVLNILIFALLTWLLVNQFNHLMEWLVTTFTWLEWVIWLLWLVVGILWLLLYGYLFTALSHLIASPFYGILAEKVEQHLTGEQASSALTVPLFLAMVGRSLVRELQKLGYFTPRFLGIVILTFALSLIPVVGLASGLIYFAWGAWALALENLDFAADNHQMSFPQLRQACRAQRASSLGFGAAAMVGASIPLFNLLALPAAVAGATALWVDKFNLQSLPKS